MVEIGGIFDDDLFEDAKQRNCDQSLAIYNAKICEPQWFEDPVVLELDDVHSTYKSRGDLAFYLGQYKKALACYDMCLSHIYETNIPMWKDIQEAKARCYIHMRELEQATGIIQQLVSLASNVDQHTTMLYLLADSHQVFKNLESELLVIQQLLILHPSNPDLWFRLASLYQKVYESKGSPTCFGLSNQDNNYYPERVSNTCSVCSDPVKTEDGSECCSGVEQHKNGSSSDCCGIEVGKHLQWKTVICTSLLQVRCLLRSVQKSISSFAKARCLQKLDLVNKELAEWDISEKFEWSCIQFLYAKKGQQENNAQSDLEKLEVLQNFTAASFEEQWFSWIHQNYGDLNSNNKSESL